MEPNSTAVVIKKFGGYDAISIEKYPLQPLNDNVEVKVEYGGLNFADIYTRKGLMNQKLPFVLGMECSGIITAVGCEDSKLKVGQRVVCYDHQCGMYSDIIRVPKQKVYPIPDHVTLETGAAIFVNYMTAYFSLLEIGNLKKNDSVLIFSCGGGVGFAATQLAKTVEGVKIYGVGSKNKEIPSTLNGVDVFVTNTDFISTIKEINPGGFDVILCNESGPMFTFLESLLKPLGRIVLLGAANMIQNENRFSILDYLKLWWNMNNISSLDLIMNNRIVGGLHLGVLMEKDQTKSHQVLKQIYQLLKEEKIKPNVHSIYPMAQIVEATKLLADRKNIGKVLISMKKN